MLKRGVDEVKRAKRSAALSKYLPVRNERVNDEARANYNIVFANWIIWVFGKGFPGSGSHGQLKPKKRGKSPALLSHTMVFGLNLIIW